MSNTYIKYFPIPICYSKIKVERRCHMEIRTLRYFLAIAQEENISKAATSLHISQPALSRAMKELEQQYQKQLFIRGNRKIQLTQDGVLLKRRAEEIIHLIDKTETELACDAKDLAGEISIGGGESQAMRYVAKSIQRIQQQFPFIHFHLFSGNGDDVSEQLNKGLLDFAIFIEPVNLESYEYIILPTQDTWGLLVSKKHELAHKKSIEASDLANLPLICSRQTLTQEKFNTFFGGNQAQLNIVATYNLLFNASLLVKEGVGCALCLQHLITSDEQSDLVFIPLQPALKANVYFAWKKYQTFSEPAKHFLQTIKEDIKRQSN